MSEIRRAPGRIVIDDDDRVTVGEQTINQMASNEARSACN
jgi:hypothetical protein